MLKNLSDEIANNKDFFSFFFSRGLDEGIKITTSHLNYKLTFLIDNLMKSKYYIGKALKKVTNYKSPYREYFNEIAGFTQSCIDFFSNKRKNSQNFRKKPNKRENYEDDYVNSKIIEEPEENDLKRTNSHKNYKIFINNLNKENQNKHRNNSIDIHNSSPQLIKHDYNIFINNITFKEIEIKHQIKKLMRQHYSQRSRRKPNITKMKNPKKVYC
jgi:hypothetical protein